METPRALIRPAPAYELAGAAPPPVPCAPVAVIDSAAPPDTSVRRLPRQSPAKPVRDSAVAALTVLFEVLDRRRGPAHLDTRVSIRVAEWAAGLARVGVRRPAEGATSSRLRRVHVQMRGVSEAEIFGSYTNGDRVLAFAGRMARVPTRVRAAGRDGRSTMLRSEYRWQLVEFTLG